MSQPAVTVEQAALEPQALEQLDRWLAALPAPERVAWALQHLPEQQVLSSSFGAQAAVSLHLLNQAKPNIPVVLIDTGYLFPETYQFIDQLKQQLQLNLIIGRPELSPAWLEARHGKLWEQGVEGLERYNQLAKIEPMQRVFEQLQVGTWYAGLRSSQSDSRAERHFLEFNHGRWKVHPLLDWTDRDIGQYLKAHQLPYHPLWEQGYISIGDTHTTARWEPGMREEDTRFFGLKRECGLHLDL